MANNILEKIIKKKIEKIEKLKQCTDLTHLKELIDKNNKYYDFKETKEYNESVYYSLIEEKLSKFCKNIFDIHLQYGYYDFKLIT